MQKAGSGSIPFERRAGQPTETDQLEMDHKTTNLRKANN